MTVASTSSSVEAPMTGALDSLSVRLSVPCPTCSRPNPVHDLLPSVHCFACGAKISTKRVWHEAEAHKEALALLGGLQKSDGHQGAHPLIALEAPTCSCGATISIPAGGELGLSEGNLNCHKCGATFQLRAAPDEARALAGIPELEFVVSEVIRDVAGSDSHPTALKCSNCGALLHTDGRQRVVQCEFCHASVELPESMWLRPGSAPKAMPFYLLVRAPPQTRIERHYRQSSLEVRTHDAQSPQTSALALEILSKMHRPRNLALLVAQNPAAPEPLLIELAKSPNEDVRRAVLARFERDGGSPALAAAIAPIRDERDRLLKQPKVQAPSPLQPQPPQLKLDPSWGETPDEQRATVVGLLVVLIACTIVIVLFSWLIIFHPKGRHVRTRDELPDQPVMVTGHSRRHK